jgi:hypothetical protein
MTYSSNSSYISTLFIFCLSVLGITIFTTDQTLSDPDIYLHISAGRWIDIHHAIPSVDPFSFTALGQPWVSHEWLSQWLLFTAYQLSGWAGLVLLGAICFSLTLSIIWQFLIQRLPLIYSLAFLSLSFACMATHDNIRPHILAWPLMAWWTARLVQAVENSDRPLRVTSCLLMIVWVNLHGSFLLGLIVMGVIAIEGLIAQPEKRKSWVYFCLLSCLACLVNPSGWNIFRFVMQTLQIDSLKYLSEWAAPSFNGPNFLALYILFLMGYALSGRLTLPWNRLTFLILLLYQAMSHGRYVSMMGILLPFFVAGGFSASMMDIKVRKLSFPIKRATGLLIPVLIAVVAIVIYRKDHFRPAQWITPERAVNFLLSQDISGHGLNHLNYGAYLIYRGIPVFMDARVDLYGEKGMLRYLNIVNTEKSSDLYHLSRELDQWHIQWTIFPKQSQVNLFLEKNPDWQKLYEDEQSIVFAKRQK